MSEVSYTVVLTREDMVQLRQAERFLGSCSFPVFDKISKVGRMRDSLNAWRDVQVYFPGVLCETKGFDDSVKRAPLHIVRLGEVLDCAVESLSLQEIGGLMVWLAERIATRKAKGKEQNNG